MELPELPHEILCKIFYEFKGLVSKSALCIQEYMNVDFKKECFVCKRNKLSLSLCPISWINFEYHPILEIKNLRQKN
jgi:hypothetical protein